MIRSLRIAFAATLIVATLCGAAAAERIFPLNDNAAGVFDQPSVFLSGSTAHVAFIGGATTSGPFNVYYAAVNAGSDFTSTTLTRSALLLKAPVAVIDNAGIGGPADNVYYDARHPKISMRTSTQVTILFQAKQTGSSDPFRLYRALLTIDSANNVTSISVRKVTGAIDTTNPGDIVDISFGLVSSDNIARVAYSTRAGSSGPYDVYLARVPLDNASVGANPTRLSVGNGVSTPISTGYRPTPSLKLDASNRSHIAWSADNNAGTAGIFYAMSKETTVGVDNVVIPATLVMSRTGAKWSFPSLLVVSTSQIVVTAGDEAVAGTAGDFGFVEVNPDAAAQDGNPVSSGQTNYNLFLLTPPGQEVLGYSLYRPEALIDGSGRIHATGFGSPSALSQYLSFHIETFTPYKTILTPPTPVGNSSDIGSFPVDLSGDYSKASFAYMSGKAIVFWSGVDNVSSQYRNLNVTTVPAILEIIPATESGCAMTSAHSGGDRSRIPGVALLFLPAILLGIRRLGRRIFAG